MERKSLFITMLLLLLLALVVGTATANSGQTGPARTAANTQAEFAVVVFNEPPAAQYDGGISGLERTRPAPGQKLSPDAPAVRAYVDHLTQRHNDYRAYLADKAPRAEVVREFSLVANALAIRLNGTSLRTLQRGPGVNRASFSALYQPTMNASVDVIGASDLWAATGSRADAGAGVKVGVIDSGIDDTHRFFDCKDEIVHKVYASGVAFDPSNTLVFDHGTHVAGTIGGCVITLIEGPIMAELSGVAPAAELWDYNVFPGYGAGYVAFGGSAFSHDIAAAIEDALADGMDVINMSLGGSVEGPHDFLAEAVDAAVDAGLVAAVAAGNSGPGDATVESPGNAANALTAGATTNAHLIGVAVEVTNDTGTTPYVAAAGDFGPYGDPVSGDLVDWDEATDDDDALACDAADSPGVVTGQLALISRGACTFTTKIRHAESAGAVGVIVYNNVPGSPISMAHDGTDDKPEIPAVMVSQADGTTILNSLPASGTIAGSTSELPADQDILAGFSSRGPTPFNYRIKPDVTAPGVNVYSSVFDDEFAMFQGTSMATPHLAGSAALLIELHPDWSQFDVKSAIVNTAERVVMATDLSGFAGVLGRGNGRVNVDLADQTPVTFDPVSVSYGFWSGNKPVAADVTLTLRDAVGDGASCDFMVTGDAYITPESGDVSIASAGNAALTFSLDAGRADTTSSGDYGGDIEFTCDGTELVVPWWVRIDRQGRP